MRCGSCIVPRSVAYQPIRRYASYTTLSLQATHYRVRPTAGGVATLSQGMIQPVYPKSTPNLTLEDVQREVILGSDIHSAPTRVIALENTYGGTILPLSEVQRISAFARANNIRVHLDGARLWNAVAAGAGTLKDYGQEFDSVSMCFSKGIGAPIGSVLVGSKTFIDRARWVRKSIGGGMRQTGVIAGAARAALDEVFPGKLAKTHEVAKDVEGHLGTLGLKTILPVDTNMIFIVGFLLHYFMEVILLGYGRIWRLRVYRTSG